MARNGDHLRLLVFRSCLFCCTSMAGHPLVTIAVYCMSVPCVNGAFFGLHDVFDEPRRFTWAQLAEALTKNSRGGLTKARLFSLNPKLHYFNKEGDYVELPPVSPWVWAPPRDVPVEDFLNLYVSFENVRPCGLMLIYLILK